MINSLQIEFENLKREIENSDIVSFDIFDTLVLRNVLHPTDVFKCVLMEYKHGYHDALDFDFYQERIAAEMEARVRSHGREDIAYDEIYDVLEEKYGEVAKRLKRIELQLESKFIVPNDFMVKLYKYALSQKKRVFLVSDMYLTKDFLDSIMQQLGMHGHEALIVSNDPMKTKHHGTIYPWLREKFNLVGDWCHIGDNVFSDVQQANKHGVRGIHYRKVSERANLNDVERIEESIIKAIEINAEFTNLQLQYWEKFSIKYASKIYFALTYWLVKDMLEQKKDNIFFIARDGYIVNQIYKKFQLFMDKLPEAKYLYASRRGYQYPETVMLKDRDESIQTFIASNPQFNQKLTVNEVFLNLELDVEKYQELLTKYNLLPSTVIKYEDASYENAKKLFKELWSEIEKVLLNEKRLVEGYLKQEGVFDFDTVNIFDIGWRGSIQKAIETITNKRIHGYYFGTSAWPHQTVQKNSTNFAVDIGNPKYRMDHISRYLMVYEFIFSAPHGSLMNFQNEADKIVPNLENIDKEEETFVILGQVHASAEALIDKYLEYIDYLESFNLDFILGDMKKMLESHPVEDMIAFGRLQNTVGFGNSRDKKQYVEIITINDYIDNHKNILQNIVYNLWPNALLISDGGRYFSQREIDVLYNIRNIQKKNSPKNRYKVHFKKMVKNKEYKYYFKRIMHVLLYKIKMKLNT